MDRSNIEKIAQTNDDKLLLAKLWDKINAGINRCIVTSTAFLSPRELHMARFLFGKPEGLLDLAATRTQSGKCSSIFLII